MWHIMLKNALLSMTFVAGAALFGSAASAATIDLVTDGSGNSSLSNQTLSGTEDDVLFFVNPDNQDAQILSVTTSATSGSITDFQVFDASGNEVTPIQETSLGGLGYSLTFTYLGSEGDGYKFRITGANGTVYGLSASVVPLPAAAWMLLSALFGGAWLKRRSARRTSVEGLATV